MRIVCLQHVAFENAGVIEDWAGICGHEWRNTALHDREDVPRADDFDWLVVMGGPMSVHDEARYPWLAAEKTLVREAVHGGKLVLGICLGAQLIAEALGARVYRADHREIGWWRVRGCSGGPGTPAFRRFPASVSAFHWHGETFDLPRGAVRLAESEACRNQAFAYGGRAIALQFHLEIERRGVEQLIANCADDLAAGPFTQSPAAMLEDPARFETAHMAMNTLLEGMAACAPSSGTKRRAPA